MTHRWRWTGINYKSKIEEIMKENVAVGDIVRVWFDGLVQEIYPPILPNVYRVVKEEMDEKAE